MVGMNVKLAETLRGEYTSNDSLGNGARVSGKLWRGGIKLHSAWGVKPTNTIGDPRNTTTLL